MAHGHRPDRPPRFARQDQVGVGVAEPGGIDHVVAAVLRDVEHQRVAVAVYQPVAGVEVEPVHLPAGPLVPVEAEGFGLGVSG